MVAVSGITIPQTQRMRDAKELQNMVNNVDPGTKRRILAMQQAGVSAEHIAEKIKYTTKNDKTQATRLVNGVRREADAVNKATSKRRR